MIKWLKLKLSRKTREVEILRLQDAVAEITAVQEGLDRNFEHHQITCPYYQKTWDALQVEKQKAQKKLERLKR